MQFLIVASTLAAMVSAAAIEVRQPQNQGPTPAGHFLLQVIDTYGNLDSGDFLSGYHTGAGQSALITESKQAQAVQFIYNSTNGYIMNPRNSPNEYPFTMKLEEPNEDSKPKGYGYVGFNAGLDGSRVFFNDDNIMQLDKSHKAGTTFAVCPEVIYIGGIYINTLATRAPGVKRNETCADVKIKAIVL